MDEIGLTARNIAIEALRPQISDLLDGVVQTIPTGPIALDLNLHGLAAEDHQTKAISDAHQITMPSQPLSNESPLATISSRILNAISPHDPIRRAQYAQSNPVIKTLLANPTADLYVWSICERTPVHRSPRG